MALAGEGDGLDREEVEEEEASRPRPSIPEELKSQEAMVELVFPLVGDRNQGHGGLRAAAQNPADESAPGTPGPQELGAADKQGDLYSKPCMPFFYRGDHKKAKIINIKKPAARPGEDTYQNNMISWMWWFTPVIPELWKAEEEDCLKILIRHRSVC
uniref:golgin subfamily A member 8T-like n=1 Tax=Macaca mulatta TaxID=9544 RepID=UPI0010A269AA|nr:golgin subfamily A member 8T-like [Macaca mulatta]